eukprot:1912013-Prymnesium_polylepis.1
MGYAAHRRLTRTNTVGQSGRSDSSALASYSLDAGQGLVWKSCWGLKSARSPPTSRSASLSPFAA